MLGNGHHLHGVVSQLGDTRQNECPEFFIGADTFPLGSNS